MSAGSLTLAAYLALATQCGAGVDPHRMAAFAQVESSMNTRAVGPANNNGTRDYGLHQINSSWFGKPGMPRNAAEAMNPCINTRAAARIIAGNDRRSACLYNTGRATCSNGYPERLQAAATALRASRRQVAALVTDACQGRPPRWDAWGNARFRCGRPVLVASNGRR